jgi:hypothetical protein
MPCQKFSYNGPAGRCSVRILRDGRVLETRRYGKTFIPIDDPCADWFFSAKEQRKWANEAAWRASLPAGTEVTAESPPGTPVPLGHAPAAPKEPVLTAEAAFLARAKPYYACRIVPGPSAKDVAWEARDRAAYDTADATPGWKLSGGNYLWLAVQRGDDFIPVCRNDVGTVLRFLIGGKLLTFAEAGVQADAPLWRRKSEEDPTLIRVV